MEKKTPIIEIEGITRNFVLVFKDVDYSPEYYPPLPPPFNPSTNCLSRLEMWPSLASIPILLQKRNQFLPRLWVWGKPEELLGLLA